MWHIDKKLKTAFDFEGLRIQDYTEERDCSASVAEIGVPAGARHRPARSSHCDKYYIALEGSVEFNVQGQPLTLEDGSVLVVHKGEWFSYENRADYAARLLLMHVPQFNLDYEEFRDEMPQSDDQRER